MITIPELPDTAPTEEPVTLDELKAHARIDITGDLALDDMLNALITSARTTAEGFTNRKLITQDWTVYADVFHDIQALPIGPLQTVLSLRYVDLAGVTQTLNEGPDFQVDPYALRARIWPAYQRIWPVVRPMLRPITLSVRVGYGAAADVPPPFKTAIKQLATFWYDEPSNVTTKQGASVQELPWSTQRLLWPYRVY